MLTYEERLELLDLYDRVLTVRAFINPLITEKLPVEFLLRYTEVSTRNLHLRADGKEFLAFMKGWVPEMEALKEEVRLFY